MESLKDYFSYNKDYEEMDKIYYNVSICLKRLHDEKKCVRKLSLMTIYIDNNNIKFDDICEYNEELKIKNIKSLSKLILGTHLTLCSNISDFSLADDEWTKNHFIEMQENISSENFPGEYLERSLVSNVTGYYHEYIDLTDSRQALASKGHAKLLRMASYSLASDDNENLYGKSAFLKSFIYPFILFSIFTAFILIMLIKIL